jgi:hypothetical protein
MYIINRRDSSKIKCCGSYQTLCLTESSVLRNRLLFIHLPLPLMKKKKKNTTHMLADEYLKQIIAIKRQNP